MLKVEKQFAERLIKLLNESMYTVAFDVKILFEKLTEQLNAWQCDEALLLHVYQALTEKKTLNYTHIFFEGISNIEESEDYKKCQELTAALQWLICHQINYNGVVF